MYIVASIHLALGTEDLEQMGHLGVLVQGPLQGHVSHANKFRTSSHKNDSYKV